MKKLENAAPTSQKGPHPNYGATSDTEPLLPTNCESENPEHKPLTIYSALKKIIRNGFFTSLSFTYSMGLVIDGLWGPRVAIEGDSNSVLAAMSLITNMKQTLNAVTITTLYFVSVLVSGIVGQLKKAESEGGKEKLRLEIGKIYRNATFWGLLVALPLMSVYYYSKDIFVSFDEPEKAASIAQSYLRAFMYTLPLSVFRVCGQEILLSFEKSKIAMALALPSLTIAIGLSAIFVYVLNMGLAGLGYGLLAETLFTAILFNAFFLLREGEFKGIPFLKSFVSNYDNFFKDFWRMLKIGFVIGLQTVGFFFATTLVDIFVGQFGEDALAAQNFVTQYSFLLIIFVLAFGQSIMHEVGRLRGAHKYDDASLYARIGFLVSLGLAIIPGVLVAISPKLIIDLFGGSEKSDLSIEMSSSLLRIVAVGQVIYSGLYNMIQVSRQAGDKYLPTIVGLALTYVGLFAGYLLGHYSDLQAYGVNLGYFGGLSIASATLISRWWNKTSASNLEKVQQAIEGNSNELGTEASNKTSRRLWCHFFQKNDGSSTSGSSSSVNSPATSSGDDENQLSKIQIEYA